MSTNTENKTKGLQSQSEQLELKTWDVMLEGEVIGSVHGQTYERAMDTLRAFRNPWITIREKKP